MPYALEILMLITALLLGAGVALLITVFRRRQAVNQMALLGRLDALERDLGRNEQLVREEIGRNREADLAMTRLFGGFEPAFYRAYEEASPLATGHEDRLPIYQLYHILNHLNLFGGGYYAQSKHILQHTQSRRACRSGKQEVPTGRL